MAEQRLPKVNQDDGTWGDILRQYLKKEHTDDGTDNAANGGHQHITITASDGTAGTAPIRLTSGPLLSVAAIGAIEFNNDTLYFTKTTGTTRMQVVMDTATQTLTNKTIDAGSNTITGLGIAAFGGISGTANSSTYLRGDGAWSAPPPGGTVWNTVTGTSQTAAVGNGYFADNATLVTITLPSTCAVGDVVEVVGLGSGGWKIAQTSGIAIRFGTMITTTGTGGYLASVHQYDAVRLVCIVANSTWSVIGSQGNITVA